MTVNEKLPSFERPPVVEVLASVQFDPPAGFSAVHFGLVWERFRDEFPAVEQKPPLSQVVERLGVVPQQLQQLEFFTEPPLPRIWFVRASGDELIQVQSDRFIRNWRAIPELENPYPRYANCIRPRMESDYTAFVSVLESQGLKPIEPNQCELTYINQITPNELWSAHSDLGAVLRSLPADFGQLLDYPTESIQMVSAHVLNDDTGQFLGRLHIAAQSAFRAPKKPNEEQTPVFVLTLTARGRPTAKGIGGVMGFLDIGHRAIVQSFDRVTTPEMHKVWGRTNVR